MGYLNNAGLTHLKDTLDAKYASKAAMTGASANSAGAAGLVPAPSAGDEGKVLLGNGVWSEAAGLTAGIPFGRCDPSSTATAFTATVPGITEIKDGTTVMLNNGVITSATNFTININGLGAYPVYSNMAPATRETTIFNVSYTLLFVFDSARVAGGCWVNYRGYYSDSNSIGYQLRTNSSTLPASDKFYRYRLLFTSADGTKWVPANTSTSTNATAKRDTNQRPIDPFGPIVYYGSTTVIDAGTAPDATALWQQYAIALGYSFNRAGAALTMSYPAPVYVKCSPQTDGSVIMNAATPYVQALPSAEDGYVYIYLGRAYSATNVELVMTHPIYYFKDGAIRLWANPQTVPTKTSDLTNDSGFLTSFTETDPTVPAWAKAASKPSYTAAEVGALPDTTSIPTKVSDLTNDSGFLTSFTETDPTVPAWAKASSKPSYTASEVGALPDTTVIPSKTSDLTNDSGFLTSFTETDPTVPSWAKASSKPSYTASEVGAVPTSRKVNGKALSADISLSASDVGALSSSTAIPSKTSDLTNDSGYITDAGVTKITTTAGAHTAISNSTGTVSFSVPTKTSHLTNDSGFLTSFTETDPTVPSWAKASTKPSYTAVEIGAQPTLISGTNIKTINNESLLGSGNITIAGGGGSVPAMTEAEIQDAFDEGWSPTIYTVSVSLTNPINDTGSSTYFNSCKIHAGTNYEHNQIAVIDSATGSTSFTIDPDEYSQIWVQVVTNSATAQVPTSGITCSGGVSLYENLGISPAFSVDGSGAITIDSIRYLPIGGGSNN